jgi:hypothetical protein
MLTSFHDHLAAAGDTTEKLALLDRSRQFVLRVHRFKEFVESTEMQVLSEPVEYHGFQWCSVLNSSSLSSVPLSWYSSG